MIGLLRRKRQLSLLLFTVEVLCLSALCFASLLHSRVFHCSVLKGICSRVSFSRDRRLSYRGSRPLLHLSRSFYCLLVLFIQFCSHQPAHRHKMDATTIATTPAPPKGGPSGGQVAGIVCGILVGFLYRAGPETFLFRGDKPI